MRRYPRAKDFFFFFFSFRKGFGANTPFSEFWLASWLGVTVISTKTDGHLQPTMRRATMIAALTSAVAGHSSLISPMPRNAIDRNDPRWSHGASSPDIWQPQLGNRSGQVQGLRHPFAPYLTAFPALYHPSSGVRRALLGAHACGMLIGACNPMVYPIHGYRLAPASTALRRATSGRRASG